MENIVAGVGEVTSIMNGIRAACTEQERSIAQVNHALADMDSVTRQNAALVEQAAAAAASLQHQAAGLTRSIGFFRLAGAARLGTASPGAVRHGDSTSAPHGVCCPSWTIQNFRGPDRLLLSSAQANLAA